MSDYTAILVEKHDRVGLIRLNRPKALNALNQTLLSELMEALEIFDADKNIGAIVITGNERAFAAGADIKEMVNSSAIEMFVKDSISIFDRIQSIHKPIIAACSGFTLGGGCELAMSCDMIIASESARFGQPEINLGVIPGAGGTQRLTRTVGKALAMEMVLNGRTLTAEEAERFGLVNKVAPLETYLDTALTLATEIANRAPLALQLGKEMINYALESSLNDGLAAERRAFYLLFASDDQSEGMLAFIDKRKANWKGQ
jgi:enoyl-CoA hydratase